MLRSQLVFGRTIQSLLHGLELLDVRLARLLHLHVTPTIGSNHDHLVSVRRILLLLIQAELCVVTGRCWAIRNILSRVVQIRDEGVFAQERYGLFFNDSGRREFLIRHRLLVLFVDRRRCTSLCRHLARLVD